MIFSAKVNKVWLYLIKGLQLPYLFYIIVTLVRMHEKAVKWEVAGTRIAVV